MNFKGTELEATEVVQERYTFLVTVVVDNQNTRKE